MSIPNPTPEVGQIWADNDERSAGAGEFEIIAIEGDHAKVRRESGRTSRISLSALAHHTAKTGYHHIGKSR